MHEAVRVAIGGRLREARQSASFSQQQAATELRISRQAISRWERGHSMPQSAEWYLIGQLYGVSLDYLVYGIRTVPVSSFGILSPVLGRPGVQPTGVPFGTPERQPTS